MLTIPFISGQGALDSVTLGIFVAAIVQLLKPWIEQAIKPSDPRHDSLFRALPFALNLAILLGIAASYGQLNSMTWLSIVAAALTGGGSSLSTYHLARGSNPVTPPVSPVAPVVPLAPAAPFAPSTATLQLPAVIAAPLMPAEQDSAATAPMVSVTESANSSA